MQIDQAKALIQQLGQAVGIPDLEFDEHGMCLIALEDDSLVNLGYDRLRECLILIAPLDEMTVNLASLRTALMANFMWQGSEGATLALEPSGRALALQREVPEDIDAARLQTFFADFVTLLERFNRPQEEDLSHGDPAAPTANADFTSMRV